MTAGLPYDDHLRRESARFAEALQVAPPGARVPSCPDWNADDLLWHLAEVQEFWAMILREDFTTEAQIEAVDEARSVRPEGRDALFSAFNRASRSLGEELARVADDVPAWTWAPEQTAGFIRRRQAHEALIHRVDAELTIGLRTPLDPSLSADGVDEVLRVMRGGSPPWGSFAADGRTVRLTATDTDATWLLALGRFTGFYEGEELDLPDLRVLDGDGRTGDAAYGATAGDLDCWLWNRAPLGEVVRTGDPAVAAAFDETLAEPLT